MARALFVASVLIAACTKPIIYAPAGPAETESQPEAASQPPSESSSKTVTEPAKPETPPARHGNGRDFPVPTQAMGLELVRGNLVWADVAGAIWTMPADGSRAPKQLSDQHKDGLAVHPFLAGDHLLAKTGKNLIEVSLPDGPVKRVAITGVADLLEDVVGDATTIFLTVFNHPQVMRVAIGGGAAKRISDAKKAVLALHGDTLYLASYTSGTLLAMPVAGGAARTIASKLKQPTALAIDDTAAYVYTEGDEKLTRIDLATGAAQMLADHLNNSDEVELAGSDIYTVDWPNKLVRIGTSPGTTTTLADDLFQPRGVVHDEHWVYVTSEKPFRIVRLPRQGK